MTAPLFANDRNNRGPWPGNLRSDNVTMSKIRKAIEAEGAELRFLPRYSPDMNPIEMSKLKTLLRKASERFVEALWSASANSSVTSHRMNAKTTQGRRVRTNLTG